jgi:hypothetical protein
MVGDRAAAAGVDGDDVLLVFGGCLVTRNALVEHYTKTIVSGRTHLSLSDLNPAIAWLTSASGQLNWAMVENTHIGS